MIKKTLNIWEYIVVINAIIANFVCLWKRLMRSCKTKDRWVPWGYRLV